MSDNKNTSIRTPLGRARGLGSAKEGTAHWWAMRVTSVLMIPISLYVLINARFFLPPPHAWTDLVVMLGDPITLLIMILASIIFPYHACLGVQTIIEDYVHGEGTKIACLLLNTTVFLLTGIISVYSLFYLNVVVLGTTGGM